VVLEVGLSLTLLVSAGLLMRLCGASGCEAGIAAMIMFGSKASAATDRYKTADQVTGFYDRCYNG